MLMVGCKVIRTMFGRIMLVESLNDFFGMREVGSRGPLIFFIGSLIAHPSDVVEHVVRHHWTSLEVVGLVPDLQSNPYSLHGA